MLSMIDVKCPHCGACGQIMVPPLGAIIVGPCPQCTEMVMVFCGRTLPLDKGLLTGASSEEKRDHVMDMLTGFLRGRVDELVDQINDSETIMSHDDACRQDAGTPDDLLDGDSVGPDAGDGVHEGVISERDLCQFRQIDLKLIDNREYFDSIFG